jgi:hypothetical protein
LLLLLLLLLLGIRYHPLLGWQLTLWVIAGVGWWGVGVLCGVEVLCGVGVLCEGCRGDLRDLAGLQDVTKQLRGRGTCARQQWWQ